MDRVESGIGYRRRRDWGGEEEGGGITTPTMGVPWSLLARKPRSGLRAWYDGVVLGNTMYRYGICHPPNVAQVTLPWVEGLQGWEGPGPGVFSAFRVRLWTPVFAPRLKATAPPCVIPAMLFGPEPRGRIREKLRVLVAVPRGVVIGPHPQVCSPAAKAIISPLGEAVIP